MKRLILLTVFMIASAVTATASNGEFCAGEKIDRDITGDWKGSNSYYLHIRHEEYGYTCISIVEPGKKTVRNVRDIIVVNGELRHLTFFTPSTGAIVVYSNIKFDDREMKYDWFSSFDLRQGKDTYVWQVPAIHKPGKTDSD